METLSALAGRSRGREQQPFNGFDATIRSVPATDRDPVFVSIDAQPGYKRGPCYGWQPRLTVVQPAGPTPLQVTPVFPQPGDPCVVIESVGSDSTQLVIVAWWPDA